MCPRFENARFWVSEMAYWLAVEVAFVSHSILKQIGEPLGKVKAVHSPSPPPLGSKTHSSVIEGIEDGSH